MKELSLQLSLNVPSLLSEKRHFTLHSTNCPFYTTHAIKDILVTKFLKKPVGTRAIVLVMCYLHILWNLIEERMIFRKNCILAR